MPQIDLTALGNYWPDDPALRNFVTGLIVVGLAALLGGVWAVVDYACLYSGWSLLNPAEGDEMENSKQPAVIHRMPPKEGTAAKGFQQVARRQQLDAIAQARSNVKCIAFISPAEPYGRTRWEGWR